MEILLEKLLLEGNILTLGCNCTGWEEYSISTLSCRNIRDCDIMQQELSILSPVLNNLPSRNLVLQSL